MRPLPRRLLPLVLLACSISQPVPLAADELPPAHPGPRSTPAGPEGGTVTALLVDPEDPQRVFAATAGSGVFLSTDRGANWSALLDSPSGVFDLSPEAPEGFLHVLLEIHRGIDGDLWMAGEGGKIHRLSPTGGSFEGPWEDRSIVNLEGPNQTLALDPTSPGVVYAGSFYGVHKWAGSGWEALTGFPTDPGDPDDPLEVTDLTFDAAGSTLWAGTFDGIYRSADGGETWQSANGGLGVDRVVRGLAAAPGVPGRLYAATNTSVYRTTDGGDHWTLVGFAPGSVRALVADPGHPDRLWATIPGSLEISEDGGVTWSLVTGLPARVETVAVGPVAGTVYAGSASGVHRSGDGGDNWQPVDRGLYAHQVVDLDAHPEIPERVLAATRRGRLYHSTDSGASWRLVTDDVYDVASSPADPSRVYASTGAIVRRSLDGGLTWQTASSLAPLFMVKVWADPEDPEVVFAAGRETIPFAEYATYLLRSADGGATWETLWEGGEVEVHDLEFGPRGPGEPGVALFTTTASFRLGVNLLRSTDGGVTWEQAGAAGISEFGALVDVAADPRRPGRFLGSSTGDGLLESLDAGDTWHPYGFGLPSPAAAPSRLLFDPTAPGTVHAAVDGEGVLRSVDGGATWIRIGGAPTDRLRGVLDLGVTGAPSTLFAGTDRGVRAVRPDSSPCNPGDLTLCLADGRFEVRVQWHDFQGGAGAGHAVPLTADTGAFWFFRDANLELGVKVLDGRGVNGFWWVFHGSLSNVPFTLALRDVETGVERFYPNLPRTFASRGDTRGFGDAAPAGGAAGAAPAVTGRVAAAAEPSGGGSAAPPAARPPTRGGFAAILPLEVPAGVATAAGTAGGSCFEHDTALCLAGGRFRVEVDWQDFDGGSGPGHVHPLTGDTGAFWFFHASNLELFVKVLDGRAVNGRFWVFYGSLSNVPFTLTVTDTATGTPRTYENPPRTFASRGDTAAF